MANADHLVCFAQGVKAWNTWREQYPSVRPNLAGARLRGAETTRGSMDDAYDAWLNGINLRDADLAGANLEEVSLRGASFERADLTDAVLRASCLHNATFRGARLTRADFRGAQVAGADFAESVLGDTLLVRLDLSQAVGLDATVHKFSSVVDIATVEETRLALRKRRAGQLEQMLRVSGFLSRCGVPSIYLALLEDIDSDN